VEKGMTDIVIDTSRDELFDEISLARLKDSYMIEGETTPQERYAFVSKQFGSNPEHAQRLYDYASKHWFGYSTPILSFGRNKGGLPISCFLVSVPDTKAGLVDSLSETNWLSMLGGGVGVYFATRGADEKSVGVIPHLKVYDDSCLAFKQGSTRRGSYAAYLDISHPDIMDFLDMRKETGDQRRRCLNLHNAVNIPDSFMKLVEGRMLDPKFDDTWELKDPVSGKVHEKVSASELWIKLLDLRAGVGRGEPYILFTDNVNNQVKPVLRERGYKVNQSNLCVAPETQILTENGYETISDLENETVSVWNGQEFSNVIVRKTGENQKLIRVITDSGFELECTPYHKFYVHQYVNGKKTTVEKRAGELLPGDKLIKSDYPVIEGTETLEYAYDNGFYTADGCLEARGQRVYLYGEKQKLKPFLSDIYGNWCESSNCDRITATTRKLKDKYFVPNGDYTIKSKLDWFAGLCDGDGTVCRNGESQSIQVCSVRKEFLQQVQLMLQTLGVYSKVTKSVDAGFRQLPKNDGSGEKGDYFCQTTYRLMIGQRYIEKLISLGFKTHRLVLTNHTGNRECTHFIKVEAIIDDGRYDDTYCFTEPKRHMGMFNGMLTGQCNEIMLHTDAQNTAVCCLSSINLDRWDEYKDNYQFFLDLMEMLDNVLQYFIDNAPDTISRAKYSAIRERSVGLGVMGYHSYLQQKGVAFDSAVAKAYNKKIFKTFKEMLDRANIDLGSSRGSPALLEGTGLRFAHCSALAPTASNALICGNVSPSIEPWHANAFRQDTLSGTFIQKNKYLNQIIIELEAAGKCDADDVWKQIVAADGSIQNIDVFDDHTKEVFKTAPEIEQLMLVEQLTDRQPYIDQGQSFNIFIRPDISIPKLHAIHFNVWKKGGKGMYYVRSEKLANAEKVNAKVVRVKLEDEIDMKAVANGDLECLVCSG
jgi:ribonucleoside-diphosphate reductase alpha chain